MKTKTTPKAPTPPGYMGFRLDPALLQELDTIANRSDRTRSGMVRHLIKQAVENSNRK